VRRQLSGPLLWRRRSWREISFDGLFRFYREPARFTAWLPPELPGSGLAALFEIDGRIENDLVAVLDAVAHFDLPAKIARDRDAVHMDDAILDHGNVQPVLIEDHRVGGNDEDGVLRGTCSSTVQ